MPRPCAVEVHVSQLCSFDREAPRDKPVASLTLVVGVGIEPTFRAFQTRANPSQLSDREEG